MYFVHYRWPGNIRELEDLVERNRAAKRSDEVHTGNLPRVCEPRRRLRSGGRSRERPDARIPWRLKRTESWCGGARDDRSGRLRKV